MAKVVEQRKNQRQGLGKFVAPGIRGPESEGYMAVDVSRTGMSLLRLGEEGRRAEGLTNHDLDQQYFCVRIPIPGSSEVLALAETVRRRPFGPLEEVGIRFRYLTPESQSALDQYLAAA